MRNHLIAFLLLTAASWHLAPLEFPVVEELPDPREKLIVPSQADFVTARMLLAEPPTAPPPPVVREELLEALRQTAIELEIMDPRETRYILFKRHDIETDLRIMRNRHREYRNAPPTSDSLMLPPREGVTELVRFNRAFDKYLIGEMELHPNEPLWGIVKAENDLLYKVWDAVRDARCEYYYVTVRRQALANLKQLVGDEAYRNCDFPPYVPTWRFRELKPITPTLKD